MDIQLFTCLSYRRVVLIEPRTPRCSEVVWRRTSVITLTSAGISSARSHTLLWPIMLAKSTTRYRAWWRKTRCVRKALKLCSEQLTTDSSTHPVLDLMLQDPVPPELINLLQKADNPLLQQIFADKETESSTTKGLSKVTVVSKFKVGAFL